MSNQKGGCAKTTTTANLAASLVELGKRVLLIDNDHQGNLTQSFGVTDYKYTIYDCLAKGLNISKAITKTVVNNIDIVASDLNYADAELALANVKGKETLLKSAFDLENLQYDYILIDCSPSLNLTTVNALVAANSVLIPLEPSIFNLEGLSQLVKIMRLIIQKFNPTLEVKGVLLTRVDSRSNLTEAFHSQLKEIFGDRLFSTLIHQTIAIPRSQIEKTPVLLYDKGSRASKEYLELAREVLSRG